MSIELQERAPEASQQVVHVEGVNCTTAQEVSLRKPWLMRYLERRYPRVWYGHVCHAAGLAIFFVMLPGQSFFLGTLTPYLMKDLSVSAEIVSLYFFLAFSGAAVWLQIVGPLIDKYGTGRMVTLAILPFVAAIFGQAASRDPRISGLCYVMQRITGQETIAFCMTIAVNKWFVAQRARAASSLSLALGAQMQITAGISVLQEAIGWRETLVLAGAVTLCVTLAALPLLRDTPEEVGLGPDGAKAPLPNTELHVPVGSAPAESAETAGEEGIASGRAEGNFTLTQAIRTAVFWYMVVMGLAFGFSWGGINVHLWAVCQEKLLPSSAPAMVYVFVGIGMPLGAISMGIVMDAAPNKDSKLRRCCLAPAVAGTAQMVAEALSPRWAVLSALFGFLTGFYIGLMQVMFATIFAFLFGRQHLGKIMAVLVGTNLFGVAVGPLLMHAGHAFFGTYSGLFAAIGCLQFLFGFGLWGLKAPLPSDLEHRVERGRASEQAAQRSTRRESLASCDEVQRQWSSGGCVDASAGDPNAVAGAQVQEDSSVRSQERRGSFADKTGGEG